MTTVRVINQAANLIQTQTTTVAGTWLATETVKLTINNVDFVITIGTLVTAAQVATTIMQAFMGTPFTDTSASCQPTIAQKGAQSIPTMTEITATNPSAGVVLFTGDIAGKPFVMASTTTSASGTVTDASVLAATGGKFWDNQDNYATNSVPVNNDALVLDSGDNTTGLLYNLTTGIQLVSMDVTAGFLGDIGLAEINLDNRQATYSEYRTPRYLTFANNSVTTTYTIGQGLGGGSQRLFIDALAGQSIVNVFATGQREVPAVPPFLFKGTHASNKLTNINGDVGIAYFQGESATIAALISGGGANSNARTYCGAGVTLTTVTMGGGVLETHSAVTTANCYGGEWTHRAGNVTTMNVKGGKVIWQSNTTTPTITTLTVDDGGTFDKSQDDRPLTITNALLLYKGSTFLDPNGTVILSGGYQLVGCSIDDVTLDLGPNRSFTVS